MLKSMLTAGAVGLMLISAQGRPATAAVPQPRGGAASGLQIETQYYRLPNGLKVVLSRDTTVPTVTVAVYYGIGFRIEPRDRTGFAHLFEHLMFQGSKHAPKGEFDRIINNNGGVNNGSTCFDYTNYFEVVPSNALEPVLWVEGDRMRGLDLTPEALANQQGVVANEVKVNVLNQPYGGWPWLDMPQVANTNWYNAHNFYGELSDLEAATAADAKKFFADFYGPSNAVLVVAGDIDYAATKRMIQRYFGSIPAGAPIKLPDISEPRQTSERSHTRTDKLAPRPAFTAAWHVPPRNSPEWYAMGLLDQILAQGQDSRLYQKLVRETGIAGGVQAGINIGLGNMYNYNGPMLWTVGLIHDPARTPDEIRAAIDGVIEDVRSRPIHADELERARTKIRSNLYNLADPSTRFGLVDLLAVGAMWEDDPRWINRLEAGFAKVTPELILATAKEYLRPTNRTLLLVKPEAAAPAAASSGAPK